MSASFADTGTKRWTELRGAAIVCVLKSSAAGAAVPAFVLPPNVSHEASRQSVITRPQSLEFSKDVEYLLCNLLTSKSLNNHVV